MHSLSLNITYETELNQLVMLTSNHKSPHDLKHLTQQVGNQMRIAENNDWRVKLLLFYYVITYYTDSINSKIHYRCTEVPDRT